MPAPREVNAEDKKAALESVLQTASFLRAEQLRQFLRFICDMEISGRAAEITEYLIGVEALGRAPGYSTAEDSIVRRRAIDLRDKLDEVYTSELSGAPIRIELPKGRYVPHFVPAPAPAPPNPSPAEVRPGPSSAAGGRVSARAFLLGFVAGAFTSAALLIALRAPAPLPAGPTAELGVTYEAESAANTLHGSTTVGGCPTCSGGARVRNIGNSPGNYVVVNGVTVAAAGNYTLRIDYFLQGQRSFFLSLNGGPGVELSLKGDAWNTPARASLSVPLRAGANSLRFGNEHTYAPDLDRIVVR